MDKRAFLRLSPALLGAPWLLIRPAWGQTGRPANWAGNVEYSTALMDQPESLDEVQRIVRRHDSLKVLGTRHCFNRIADSTERLVALTRMNKVVALDANARQVTVEGGITYGHLCPYLHEKGFALHNLASLPHISVAGACATATHGSGMTNGNLATAVTGLELVTADGSLVQLSQVSDRAKLHAAVVGLGALGIVTKVTLAIRPTFLMRQHVYQDLPMSQLSDHFEDIMSSAYSVSLFTDWQQQTVNEVWVKSLGGKPAPGEAGLERYGATRAARNLHPIAALSAENCTEQMGVPGPWYERLPHFRMGFTPSSGAELQAEVLRAAPTCGRGDSRNSADGEDDRTVSIHFRSSDRIRRRALDEPALRSRVGGHPFHLEAGLAGGRRLATRNREGTRAVRGSTALGQAVQHAPRGSGATVREVVGVPRLDCRLRSEGQVPQRVSRVTRLPRLSAGRLVLRSAAAPVRT